MGWVLLTLGCFSPQLYAHDLQDEQSISNGLTGIIDSQQTHSEMELRLGKALLCPSVDHLIKQGEYWYAEGGWRSWEGSMTSSLQRFVGANWQGAYTGVVTCYYDNNDSDVFPVTMIRSGIYRYPEGGTWKPSHKHGVLLCQSNDPNDCPFQEVFYESRHLKTDQDVKDLLDSIKDPNPVPKKAKPIEKNA